MISRLARLAHEVRHASIAVWCMTALYGLGWLVLPALANETYGPAIAEGTRPLYRAWGEPRHIEWMPWSLPGTGYLVWIIGFALLVAFTAWRSMLAVCTRSNGIHLGGIYLILAVLLTGSAFMRNVEADCTSREEVPRVVRQLATIRSQIELYQVHHGGNYPRLDQLWDVMTKRTDESGRVLVDGNFGPYLQQPPVNWHYGNAHVAADRSASWIYDENTGAIAAVLPPPAMYELKLDGIPDDVQPAEVGSFSKAWWQTYRIRVGRLIESATSSAAPPSLFVVWIALITMLLRPQVKRWHHAVVLLVIVTSAALLLVEVSQPQFQSLGLTKFLAGFALLIAWFLLVIMQNDWDCIARWKNGWHDPSRCRRCDYDLTGSLAAQRYECPECGAAVEQSESLARSLTRGTNG